MKTCHHIFSATNMYKIYSTRTFLHDIHKTLQVSHMSPSVNLSQQPLAFKGGETCLGLVGVRGILKENLYSGSCLISLLI